MAIAITVGLTLFFMRLFRPQILKLAKEPEEVDGHSRLPMLLDVTGSVIGLTTMAFVFFTAFGLSNYWSTAKSAETATQSEAMEYATARSYANLLPDPAAKAAVLGALSSYRENVITIQQPMLEAADRRGAYAAQGQASLALGTVIMTARAADATASPFWSDIDDAFNAMVDDGYERVRAIPTSVSVGYVEAILGATTPTLVVWHHGSIPAALHHLPMSNASDVPHAWPEDRFDLIWLLTWDAKSEQYRFEIAQQSLLSGDQE